VDKPVGGGDLYVFGIGSGCDLDRFGLKSQIWVLSRRMNSHRLLPTRSRGRENVLSRHSYTQGIYLCVKFIRHRHSISCICRWSRDGYFGSSHKIFPIGIINFLLCLHQIILNLLMCQMKQSDSVPTRIFSTGMRCTRVAGRIKNESWMPSLNKTENC
jgi:hypothetical protein